MNVYTLFPRPSLKALAALIVALSLAASTSQSADPRKIVAPPLEVTPPQVESFTLENGLQVFFLESHDLPVVRMTLLFPGGSAYEPDEICGVGAITAALMRSGGAGDISGDAMDEELDFLAAGISSSAEQDKHRLTLKCLKKDFSRVFELFSMILTAPRFDSARLELEKSNKKESILRQFDSPTGATRILFYQTLYGGKLYGRYPTLKSIDAITAETVRRNYNKVYNPAQGFLAVSGDLTHEELEGAINKRLGPWKGQQLFERPIAQALAEDKLPKPGVYYAYKDINQTSIRLGHLTDLFQSPDRFAVRVMNYAVGVGFTGRLTRKVRSEAGLAYSVGGYFVNRPMRGTYFAYCQTKADATAKSLRMIIDILKDVKEHGITRQEFERSKNAIVNSFVFEFETPHQIVESVASNVFYGFSPEQTQNDLESLKAVTYEDCQRVANKYYRPEDFRIVVVGDTAQMDAPLSDFGETHMLSLDIE